MQREGERGKKGDKGKRHKGDETSFNEFSLILLYRIIAHHCSIYLEC